LKTCPLFAAGSSGRSEGLYLACLRESVLKFDPLLLSLVQVAIRGVFYGWPL